jgi:hypothetical protein
MSSALRRSCGTDSDTPVLSGKPRGLIMEGSRFARDAYDPVEATMRLARQFSHAPPALVRQLILAGMIGFVLALMLGPRPRPRDEQQSHIE